MPRSRNIKPGFFVNEDLVELEYGARLLFIGLWTIADREGRLEDRPKKIKMSLFPADNADIDQWLQLLNNAGFIHRYDAEGIKYIQILNFKKHQNPHVKEAKSTIPAPDEHSTSTGQAPDEHHESPADSLNLIPDSCTSTPSGAPSCPHEEIISLYHENLPSMPKVRAWTEKRKGLLRARWKEEEKRQNLKYWSGLFEYIAKSDFLNGRVPDEDGSKPFIADLEWLVNPNNFAKVIEGKYENRTQ